MVVATREQWPTGEHLSEDASDCPYIDRFGVLLEGKHNLRSTVPSRGDVFGHEAGVLVRSEH